MTQDGQFPSQTTTSAGSRGKAHNFLLQVPARSFCLQGALVLYFESKGQMLPGASAAQWVRFMAVTATQSVRQSSQVIHKVVPPHEFVIQPLTHPPTHAPPRSITQPSNPSIHPSINQSTALKCAKYTYPSPILALIRL